MKYTYEDWGNVSKFEQDHDSAIGGTLLYDVDYGYAKATTGRNTMRRTSMTLPNSKLIDFGYTNGYDDEASRVTTVKDGVVTLATYGYNGVSQLVGIDLDEVDVMWHQYGSPQAATQTSTGSTASRRAAGRRTWRRTSTSSIWTSRTTATRTSRSSRTTSSSTAPTVGSTSSTRSTTVTASRTPRRGTGTAARSRRRPASRSGRRWTRPGNWDHVKLDLDGDGSFTGTDEYDDDRTHNVVNELTARDTDNDTTDDFTLTYDEVGNLTDDGENYEYVFDAFGRLREVKDTGDQSTVAEYEYNGLGYRITWHYDADADGDVDSNDPTYRFVYDERWRIVATYRAQRHSTATRRSSSSTTTQVTMAGAEPRTSTT